MNPLTVLMPLYLEQVDQFTSLDQVIQEHLNFQEVIKAQLNIPNKKEKEVLDGAVVPPPPSASGNDNLSEQCNSIALLSSIGDDAQFSDKEFLSNTNSLIVVMI
jgi:hypothetical protein